MDVVKKKTLDYFEFNGIILSLCEKLLKILLLR